MQPAPPYSALTCWWWLQALGVAVGFNYLFIYSPGYVALWDSKTPHRRASETVSWCLETSSKTPFQGQVSVPNSFASLFIFYILSYFLSETMLCLYECLMSSASIQKLFCEIYSVFKCSIVEFIEVKVVSPSYSSTILGQPLEINSFSLTSFATIFFHYEECLQLAYNFLCFTKAFKFS